MSELRLLLDTNIIIGLEDNKLVSSHFSKLRERCSVHNLHLVVHPASIDDVNRDRNIERRKITLSKLEKFEFLGSIPVGDEASLVAQFGPIRSDNDRSDVRLLYALVVHAAHFLVTEDTDLHIRAKRSGLGSRVLDIEDALAFIEQSYEPKKVPLPYISDGKAYQIDRKDPILDSLRADYSGFDNWLDRCGDQGRECWFLSLDDKLAGFIIRKDETHVEAGTVHPGPKILKLCTFKISPTYTGEKFGEHLLKQALWYAQRNS